MLNLPATRYTSYCTTLYTNISVVFVVILSPRASAESQLDQLKETKQWFDDHSSFYVELHAFCKDHIHVHFF